MNYDKAAASPAQDGAEVGLTRTRLLEAAIGCIQTKGYGATTARDLSAVSGANLASIGYHFGSKEALLDEALAVATDRWIGPIIDQGRRAGDGAARDRISTVLTQFVDSLPENRGSILAFFEALARAERSQNLRSRLAQGYESLREAVIEGVLAPAQNQRSTGELDALASAIIALCDGLMLQWLLDPARTLNVMAMVDALGDALQRPTASGEQ